MSDQQAIPCGVKELGHVVLYVRELEHSVRFYWDVLGWRQAVPGATMPFPAAMYGPRSSPFANGWADTARSGSRSWSSTTTEVAV